MKLVCIDDNWWNRRIGPPHRGPKVGEIVTVIKTVTSRNGNPFHVLEGYGPDCSPIGKTPTWNAKHFRPIHDDKPEPCDEEFLWDLFKQKEPA